MEEIVNILTTFISNCGFPIFACIMIFLQNNKLRASIDENTKAINSMRETNLKLVERIDKQDAA